jgi:hypothetical protein
LSRVDRDILAIMGSILELALRPAGIFLAPGAVLVLVGAIGLVAMFSWRPIFPGVLTPLILIGGGGILLLFSVAHYLLAKLSAVQMSRLLAAITLVTVLAGIDFYFASARSMEAYLDSAAPTGDAGIAHMIRSVLCGAAALIAFAVNVIVTFKRRRSVTGVSPS